MNEASAHILSAIDNGRTDIIRSLISSLEKNEVQGNNDEELHLDDLLNNASLTPVGTILHYASQANQPDIVRALLSAGSDPGIHNEASQTPLDLAADDHMKSVFNQQLLQCVAASDVGKVCQLLAAGVNVNSRDSATSLNTPLHWAASFSGKDTVQCLCKRGADVNSQNIQGVTPLHDAVARGAADIVQELLQAGALPHIKATAGKFSGKTATDLAVGMDEVVKVLENPGDEAMLCNSTSTSEVDIPITPGSPVISKTFDDMGLPRPVATATQNGLTNSVASSQQQVEQLSTSTLSSTLATPSHTIPQPQDSRLQLLWPRPHTIICREGLRFKAPDVLYVYVAESAPANGLSLRCIWKTWEQDFSKLGVEIEVESVASGLPSDVSHVLCQVNKHLMPCPQSYSLYVSQNQIKMNCADSAGLQHSITTLLQLLKLCQEEGIPPLLVRDQPALKERGVLLDMSKGRIPTLESLKNLVRDLAYIKINQLQLYTRVHVPTDEELTKWQFPHTRSALLEVDEFCWSRGIVLVPVLDINPRVTYNEITELYPTFHQYLSCFAHTHTIGVGPRLTSVLVDFSEDGVVNLDDLWKNLPTPSLSRSPPTLQICSYIFHDSPNALHQIPANTVLAEYGFQAEYDFERQTSSFEKYGVPFCVVPGTAAWNSLAGCPEAAVNNIFNGVQSAVTRGALGVITSQWSGVGHVTHMPMNWPGFVTAAGTTWNSGIDMDYIHSHLAELINTHVLHDSAGITGQVIIELGRAETYLLRCARNQAGSDHSDLPAEKGTVLYQMLSHPDEVSLEYLSAETFMKAMRHVRKCQSELSKAALQCEEASLILAELQLTADLMLSACRMGRSLVNAGRNPTLTANPGYAVVNLGISNLPATTRTDMANRLLDFIENYRAVWLSRSLPVGLSDSLLILSSVLKQCVPETVNHHG